ncbi:MAG: cyclase family protein [Ktedonobacteraceae bacterium]|nr:cyclase family protein [Ktedonobacteraceae bacterium]
MMKDPQLTTNWIDISVPLYTDLVHWPDDPSVQIERVTDLNRGDVATVSKLSMCIHSGTHMDAPAHFLKGGASIDTMPIEATIGRARVIEIQDSESINSEELERLDIRQGERILFKTKNSTRAWQSASFVQDFVYISYEAAQYLAKLRIQTVGIDYLSVSGFTKDGPETHYALLAAGIWIIEGLNLSQVPSGTYELVCLPLKMLGCEGAPARAVLRSLGGMQNT